ncbi:MAG: hypothetical protein U0350_39020 [Caldilineaceae bacterium]
MKSKLLLCSLLLGALLFIYLGTTPWSATPDGVFHLQRVRAVSEALQAGVLFPRWFPDFAFGYGFPVLNFYSPGFYYPPALLHLAGLDLLVAVRLTLALLFAGSGLTIWLFLRSWASPAASSLGAVVYLFFPYHLYDLFVRGALPEFAAFLWPPLIAYFGYHLFMETAASLHSWREVVGAHHFVGLAFAWTGLILTHNLTAFMTLLLSLLVYSGLTLAIAFGWLPKGNGAEKAPVHPVLFTATPTRAIIWWRNLRPQGLALLLGFLLSAFYLAPALLEARWVQIGANPDLSSYRAHFMNWSHLVSWTAAYVYPSAADALVLAPVYALLVIFIAAGVLFMRGMRERRWTLLLLLLATLFTLWIMTANSTPLWQVKFSGLSQLHFPWRWYTLFTPLVAVLCTFLFDRLQPLFAQRPAGQLIFLALTLCYVVFYGVLHLPHQATALQSNNVTAANMWAFDATQGQVGTTWMAEFLPRDVTEQRWAIGREPTAAPPPMAAVVAGFQVQPLSAGYLNETYKVTTRQPLSLTWPLFYYPAWQVTVDGKKVATSALTSLGLLAVSLPAGTHQVQRLWAVTPAVWIGDSLSGLALLVILFLLLMHSLKRFSAVNPAYPHQRSSHSSIRRSWKSSGFVLGISLFTGLLLLPAATFQPQRVGADYGSVRLEAASTASTRAGETATVQLWWSIVGPVEPLTAFVHIIGADGQVIAQHDGPLAGDYIPAARWLPGQIMRNQQFIPLPATLPPGRYTVKAGLYRPGQANQPLTPLGHNQPDPRVEIGVLEIH